MSEGESTALVGGQKKRSKVANKGSNSTAGDRGAGTGPAGPIGAAGLPRAGGGHLRQYKPEQGKWTRMGTFVGLMSLVAWGGYFLYERLEIFSGDEPWRLVVSRGVPLAVVVLFGVLAWWVSYSHRSSSDFMIATEGEMKKVNWSTRREIIGSTKVVILFTVLLAGLLFVVDLSFQTLFSWIGILKK